MMRRTRFWASPTLSTRMRTACTTAISASRVCRSRTPLYIQTLLELYAQAGLIGVTSYQFADWKFFAPPTYQPIVFGNLDAAGA